MLHNSLRTLHNVYERRLKYTDLAKTIPSGNPQETSLVGLNKYRSAESEKMLKFVWSFHGCKDSVHTLMRYTFALPVFCDPAASCMESSQNNVLDRLLK